MSDKIKEINKLLERKELPNDLRIALEKRKEILLPLNGDRKQGIGVSQSHKEMFLKEFEKWQQAVN